MGFGDRGLGFGVDRKRAGDRLCEASHRSRHQDGWGLEPPSTKALLSQQQFVSSEKEAHIPREHRELSQDIPLLPESKFKKGW